MTNHYEIDIVWSQEDETFIARVPELPGCLAHGASQSEALANVQEAISLWIETAREAGDRIPEPGSVSLRP